MDNEGDRDPFLTAPTPILNHIYLPREPLNGFIAKNIWQVLGADAVRKPHLQELWNTSLVPVQEDISTYRLGISIALTIRSFDLSAQLIDRDSMEFTTRRKFEFLLHAVHANLSRILTFASTNTEAANTPR